MNPPSSASPLQRASSLPSENRDRRRVYLDTYAKKRGTAPQATATVAKPSSQSIQTTSSLGSNGTAMPMFVTPQSLNQTPVPTQQPILEAPTAPRSAVKPLQQQASVIPVTNVAPKPSLTRPQTTQDYLNQVGGAHKTYLDTIVRRPVVNAQPQRQVQQPPLHVAPLATAPAVTTVEQAPTNLAQQQQNVQTSHNEQRIEANLRVLYQDETSLTNALMKDDQSASLSHMRTIVASAFACGIIAVSMFTFLSQASSQPVVAQPIGAPVIEVEAPIKQPVSAPAVATGETTRVAVNPNHPVRLVIGGIAVNAPIEAVGQTPEGLMAVPKSYGIVGWYNKGVYPGQKGPAVIAGHYTGGYGGVFDRLADLKDGDLITTTNGKGENFTYKVVKKVEYEKDKVPMAELFKTSDESRLEIITCSGKWQAQNYGKRLVVTAELVR